MHGKASSVAWIGLLALALLVPGCIGGGAPTAEDRRKLAAYILEAPPAKMPIRLNVDFDGKVTLLGADVQPARAAQPGTKVRLTLYWQPKVRLPAGWLLFTHVMDGAGVRILNIDNVGPLRQPLGSGQMLGPSAWSVGKVYADEQEFVVPLDVKSRRIQVVTGIWRGSERMPVKSGPHDQDNRAIVAELSVGASSAESSDFPSTRVPLVRVDKLESGTTITVDGRLDEDAWRRAPLLGPFVDVSTGAENPSADLGGSAKLAWDDRFLYLGMVIVDAKVSGGFDPKSVDPHLWTRDTAEIMVDPDGDGDNKDYYEIQINPQNLVFDSRFDRYNSPKVEPNGPFGHQDWSANLTSMVSIQGTLDHDQDRDQGYTVEAKIPWKSFDRAEHVPPRTGDEWRMNFYAMQDNAGDAWSPILGQGNFHKASRFGRVLWAAPGWVSPDEPPTTAAAPGPSPSTAVRQPAPSGAPSALRLLPIRRR